MTRTIVFTRTKRGADRVAADLDEAGIGALAIHGNKSQGQRERALAAFRAGQARALVATDIAARGIDIDGVSHVINFELPEVPEAYVHRIGRTARAGKGGQAISLCDAAERDLLRAIERLTRLRIFSLDRRGDKGPKPAPVVRKAAARRARSPASRAPSRSALGHPAAPPRPPGSPLQADLPGQSRAGALNAPQAKTGGRGARRPAAPLQPRSSRGGDSHRSRRSAAG